MIPYQTHPILFRIGPITLYTYGLFVALAFFTAIHLSTRYARKKRIKEDHLYNLGIWIVIGGILGGRIFYVLQFGGNPLTIWKGGLVFYGGLLGALLAIYIYCRKHRLKFFRMTDILAPYLALGQSIGRIGCYFRGCCHGHAMERAMPWAIEYLGERIHPTQLYSILANLGVFAFLKKMQQLKKRDGFVTAMYLLSYPVLRFIIEFYRDEPRYAFGLSIAQITGIGLFAIGSALMYHVFHSQNTAHNTTKLTRRKD